MQGLTLKQKRNGKYKYRTKVINLVKVPEVIIDVVPELEGVVPPEVNSRTNRHNDIDLDTHEAHGGGGDGGVIDVVPELEGVVPPVVNSRTNRHNNIDIDTHKHRTRNGPKMHKSTKNRNDLKQRCPNTA